MPAVIALLECREARAREELESWLGTLREGEGAATSGADPLLVGDPGVVAAPLVASVAPAEAADGAGRDMRPPRWQLGLGGETGRMNEVEKVRHRAYALEALGWLVREQFRRGGGVVDVGRGDWDFQQQAAGAGQDVALSPTPAVEAAGVGDASQALVELARVAVSLPAAEETQRRAYVRAITRAGWRILSWPTSAT